MLKYFSKEEVEKIARKVGFVQREGKLKAWQFLYLCAFSQLDVSKDTLVTMSANLSSKTKTLVSSQAIDQRLNSKAVEFLKEIFTRLLNNITLTNSNIPTVWDSHFNRIRIVDSTAFQIPEIYKSVYPGSGGSSQPSGIKIQLEYELKSGNFMHIDVGPGSGNDNTFGSKIKDTFKAGDLSLRDLGYFNFKDFEDMEDKKSFYLSRIKPNIAVYVRNENIEYLKNGQPRKSSIYKRLFLKDIANRMQEGQIKEIPDAFVGRTEKRRVRLVIYKLTQNQFKDRKEKVFKNAKKKGIKKSANTIDLMGITIYMTNIPNDILFTKQIHDIYSLRWQIELIFKIWKSVFHISSVKPVKIERFKCQLYGKLILLVLSSIVMFKMRSELLKKKKLETSEIKTAEIVHEYVEEMYFSFMIHSNNLKVLTRIYNCICKNGRKSHRKDKKTFFGILGVSYNHQEKGKNSAA
ncbi:IS4 family transposase [Clostridium tyrobutyricum]|uniref:IS4 family transposase n=1 Tax=Clostridium tyrobutyricum TaxID=1519 RepID=UPI0020CD7200|nr:IS4 family transposase [Clostridium tyrobutyricum]